MNEIRINGENKELVWDKEAAIKNIVDEITRGFVGTQQVISEIQIDGQLVTEENEAALLALPVEKIAMIEILTSTPRDLAYETLDTLERYIDRLCSSIERAGIHYAEKNLVAGDAYFLKSIDGLDLFIQTIGGVKAALRVGAEQTVMLAEADLMSTMHDLVEAKQQNNYVFMSQLLQNEFIENLNHWKTVVFPFLRMWKTS